MNDVNALADAPEPLNRNGALARCFYRILSYADRHPLCRNALSRRQAVVQRPDDQPFGPARLIEIDWIHDRVHDGEAPLLPMRTRRPVHGGDKGRRPVHYSVVHDLTPLSGSVAAIRWLQYRKNKRRGGFIRFPAAVSPGEMRG